MKNSKDLKVKFVVTRKEELGWRRYFVSDGGGDSQVYLFNFPPFLELVDSKISVVTSRVPSDRPRSCAIVARELPLTPGDRITSYFDKRIPGVSWSLASLEASWFDERDSFSIRIPQKSGITSHEKLKAFLFSKYYIITEPSFSKPHSEFEKKMKKMKKKSFTEKDVLAHFDFPEVLSYPW